MPILNSMVGSCGVTAANGKQDGLVQAGNIWIAKTGGHPVRWKVIATARVAGGRRGVGAQRPAARAQRPAPPIWSDSNPGSTRPTFRRHIGLESLHLASGTHA